MVGSNTRPGLRACLPAGVTNEDDPGHEQGTGPARPSGCQASSPLSQERPDLAHGHPRHPICPCEISRSPLYEQETEAERVSPTPEATPQEMDKLQSQPRSAFCPSPRAHSASLPPVLSPRGPGRERGGSWPSEATGCEATGCAWQARRAGPHRRTGRTNEPAGGEKQDHGRLRWRRTDFSTAKGSSLAFSTQFLP